MVVSKIFVIFTPDPWGKDPIWRSHIFQMGWNHQLGVTWENRAPKDWQLLLSLGDVGFQPYFFGLFQVQVIMANPESRLKQHGAMKHFRLSV